MRIQVWNGDAAGPGSRPSHACTEPVSDAPAAGKRPGRTQVTVVGNRDQPSILLLLVRYLIGAVVVETQVEQGLIDELNSQLSWNVEG